MFLFLQANPVIVLIIVFAIVLALFYAIHVSQRNMVINHMKQAGCSDIKFVEGFWKVDSHIFTFEYVDQGGNKRKNRCVFLTGPFIKDGIFWEEPLNL